MNLLGGRARNWRRREKRNPKLDAEENADKLTGDRFPAA